MKEPIWISRDVVLAIQEDLLAKFGGLPGIRDEGLLDSALHRPQQALCYDDPALYDLAAIYAAGIIKNHPFLDGNKRAGFMVAYTFLVANGETFTASEEDVVIHTLALAAGEADEVSYAAFLKKACRKPRRTRKTSREV